MISLFCITDSAFDCFKCQSFHKYILIQNMQIEVKQSKLPPNFIIGGNRYNIESSIWKHQNISSLQKLLDYNYAIHLKFDFHKLVLLHKSIKIFGKSELFEDFKADGLQRGNLYSMSLLTGSVKEQPIVSGKEIDMPEFRSMNGMIDYEGQICIFGGVKINKEIQATNLTFFNDLYRYCQYTNAWTQLSANNQQNSPCPRIPKIFTAVDGTFFIFGGKNFEQTFNDAYTFAENKWSKLEILTSAQAQMLSKLQGISYCVQNEVLYIFGGCNPSQFYFSDLLFRVNIDSKAKTISFQQISFKDNNKNDSPINRPPCPRSHHSMIPIDKNYFAVVGGKGLAQQKKYQKLEFHQRIKILTDIIFYDTNNNLWVRVHPLNGPIPKSLPDSLAHTQLQAFHYNHSIFILNHKIQDNVGKPFCMQVDFAEYEVIRPEMCGNCSKRIKKEKQHPLDKKSPFLSNGLIYNLAFQINFPFQAFGLIADCALALEAQKLSVKLKEQNGKYNYFEVKFNGKGISHQNFRALCSHTFSENDHELNGPLFMEKLKIGCLRIGKTFLFLNTCIKTGFRRAFFFSADSLIIHDFQSLYYYMAYEESIIQNYISTKDGIYNKKYILNYLKAYTNDPEKLIDNRIDESVILIFETNKLCNENKQNYPELVQRINATEEREIPTDIIPHKDLKKAEFLEKVGVNITCSPEISLKNYLSLLYLNKNNKHFSQIKVQDIDILKEPAFSYYRYLEHLSNENSVAQILKAELVELGESLNLQCAIYKQSKPIQHNYGILIYFQERLVNRFDTKLGSIFWQKFYKNKYKNGNQMVVFPYLGVINIKRGLTLNICMNGFVNNAQYNKFHNFITSLLNQQMKPLKDIIEIVPENQEIITNREVPRVERQEGEKPVQKQFVNPLRKIEIREEIEMKKKQPVKKVEKPQIIDLIDENNSEEINRGGEEYERYDGTKRVKRDLSDQKE